MTRVLYMEDDAALARLVERRLGRLGYELEVVGDGRSGLERVAAGTADVVIVDYWMPGMDGAHVLREVGAMAGAPPVIMVTGSEDVSIAIESMKLGAADYVIKDVEGRYLDLLPSVVERVLSHRRMRRERDRANAMAHVTLRSIGDAVLTTDGEGRLTSLNPVAQRLIGCREEQARGEPIEALFRLLDEGTLEPIANPVHAALERGEVLTLSNHTLLERRDGSQVAVADSAAPIRDEGGAVLGSVLVFQDVTERREWERSLELFRNIFQNTSEAVIITDTGTRIVDVNDAFTVITGYGRDEVLGCNPNIMRSGRHDAEFFSAMWRDLHRDGAWQGEIWDRRKNGEVYPKWLAINAVHDRHGQPTHYVGIFSDITPIKRSEERLYRLAHFDALTDLPNRMLFQDRLQQALFGAGRNKNRVAVMFIDLDRFKVINDTLGHRAGDELLVQAARRLAAQVRQSDTVARLGGDEFTVILNGIGHPDAAAAVASKIIEAFADPFQVAGEQVFTSPSIGISLYPDAGDSVDSLLKAADIAMYHAKSEGRNTYRFYREDVDRMTQEHLVLENELRQAQERGELSVYFQPQLEVSEKRIVGMEALLRWNHPRFGVVLPECFIPLAEETGLIVPIGAWVLETACRQAVAWSRAGHGELHVAVNVSQRQLIQGDAFVDTVAEALERSGLAPGRLELEITETHVLHNAERVAEVLQALKRLGVCISIDDFGTGYSSLGYLKRFPVDALKIDRSFISQLPQGADDAAISRAIIALANSLDLRVVAEGVESAEQLGFLLSERCAHAQGFLLGRPLPPEEVAEWLLRAGKEGPGGG